MDRSAPNLPESTPETSTLPAILDGGVAHLNLDPRVRRELARLNIRQSGMYGDGDDDNDNASPPTVTFNPVKRHLHHTWAQTFFSRPELYFQPTSVAELQTVVTVARRCRRRLCVTGFGHSPSDLTCTSSWLVNLDRLDRVLEVDVGGERGLVRAQAGISLNGLNRALAVRGYTMPNLGSIDVQSIAGAIATGTHGSSLRHGILSQSITGLVVLLSNSRLVACDARKNPDLFRAALCSLGSLGIVVEVTFHAVPDFCIAWSQSLHTLSSVLGNWNTTLWTSAEYTRVWWLPYLKQAVVWRANQTEQAVRPPQTTFYGGALGYYVYHNLLALSNYVPRILPWVEWFVFGMQYGFRPGAVEMTAVEPARAGLLMDCLYSQFVNEWALPLRKGPEAITRLSAWIHGDDATARIPFSSRGVWVHCPIEVRVSDTNTANNRSGVRPFLDPTATDGPTLYLNATLYRPYGKDPPCHLPYYEAFEWLMRDLGGRPHWAKNFAFTGGDYIADAYGDDMNDFMRVRDEVDPDGMLLGEWHVRNLPVGDGPLAATDAGTGGARRSMVEGELRRRYMGFGWGDGVLWEGARVFDGDDGVYVTDDDDDDEEEGEEGNGVGAADEMASRTSEESFDLMAKGEASVYASA